MDDIKTQFSKFHMVNKMKVRGIVRSTIIHVYSRKRKLKVNELMNTNDTGNKHMYNRTIRSEEHVELLNMLVVKLTFILRDYKKRKQNILSYDFFDILLKPIINISYTSSVLK